MKMRKTKNVRFRETVDVFITPSSQVTDTEDSNNVTDLALDLANDAIAAAVQIVQDDQIIKNIKWITHGEFTAERGRKQIEAFVLTWDYHDHWAHYTKLIEKKDMVHSFYYIYVVRWSIPTANTPTALSSASAYFTIKINKNKPPDAPIDVSYIFEGQSLVHRPGMSYFREQWQREFIEARHIFMESVPF